MGNNQSQEEEHSHSPGLRHRESKSSVRSRQSHVAPRHLPTASLVPSSSASTVTSTAHAHGVPASSPSGKHHSRARSITSSAVTPQLRTQDSASSHKSENSHTMGNAESRHRPPSRSNTLPPSAASSDKPSKPPPSDSSQPVDVPQPHDGPNEKDAIEPSGPTKPGTRYDRDRSPAPRYDRPPRLPLPIEEEPLTPGSPILSPQDLTSPADTASDLDNGVVPRRTSMLSSTTVDDDEEGDNDVFSPDQSEAPLIPTRIDWRGNPEEKVYVTGTFVNWERKFKLHASKDGPPGLFSTILHLKPGTHHIKFLVGQDMVTSNDLPTTVDYTNILVNYIEVVAPLLPSTESDQTQQQPPAPAEPMPIPGAALTAGQIAGTAESGARPLDIRTEARAPETAADYASTLHETVAAGVAQPTNSAAPTPQLPQPTPQETRPKPKPRLPRPQYTSAIPQFFLDTDLNNPADERYQRASRVVQVLPPPPSLPMFLSKSILNATTPHKDDASVLTMPNHTVLNHLATSSIKSGVLATSGTTRYKRKVRPSSFPIRCVTYELTCGITVLNDHYA
jgi:hypothetical protein